MSVPERLDGWTTELVVSLCAEGANEGERHDFKFGLQDGPNVTKTCCAFANSFGGFLIYGVRDNGKQFQLEGLEPNSEFLKLLRDRMRADPEIEVLGPKMLKIPGTEKLLYVFHVPKSTRRPHLPTDADRRVFWKRSGSQSVQMTLEEIRAQMLAYEEKLEKLALMAYDLSNKARTLQKQAMAAPGSYFGDVFQFDIADRVVVEAYSLLKVMPDVLSYWEGLKQDLMLLNFEKQKLLNIQAMSYDSAFKNQVADNYTKIVKGRLENCLPRIGKILERLKEVYGVEVPGF